MNKKADLGQATNNFGEIMSLKFPLISALGIREWNCGVASF